MNKALFISILLLLLPGNSFSDDKGIGYITRHETTVYSNSSGPEKDEVLKTGFPLVAWEASSVISGKVAAESQTDGRLHVRYWHNGFNSEQGENTGWVYPSDVKRFAFDCCNDTRCSGIKAVIFKSARFSDCFNIAFDEALERMNLKDK